MYQVPLERLGVLFWLAVAVLASRVLLEFGRALGCVGRGLTNVLRLTGRFIATGSARPQVILLVPTPAEPEGPAPRPAAPRPIAPPAPVLLESMSHDEMDSLLKTWN